MAASVRDCDSMACGYASETYARSFEEVGRPRFLPTCRGWIIERNIPASTHRDAIGCYPLFCCDAWRSLGDDLAHLGDIVSLSLVTDPFAPVDPDRLREVFDHVAPFKQHFVAAPEEVLANLPRKHRRNVARARERLAVSRCESPLDHLDTWCAFYEQACARLGVVGIRRFSPRAFRQQLAARGVLMFKALLDQEIVGLHLWYVDGDKAYAHLSAVNDRGRSLMASYALYHCAVTYLAGRVTEVSFGASAGYESNAPDGLSRFKTGWASSTRPVFLCGKILQPEVYDELSTASGARNGFFPAYRKQF